MTTVSPVITAAEEVRPGRSETQWQVVFRRFRRHRMAMISLAVLAIIFVAAFLAPVLAPFPRDAIVLGGRFQPPLSVSEDGKLHLLGTDHLGRDYFTRLMYAGRVSLTVALSVSIIAAVTGQVLGLLAGYFGGWVDTIITRTAEFLATFPTFTVLLIVGAIIVQNENLIPLPGFIIGPVSTIMAVSPREAKGVALIVLILALLNWTQTERLMRGMVLSVREQLYIEAARALGGSNTRIIGKHAFPNAFPPLIVDFTLLLNTALVLESALSFLGFGIQDPTPTWGNTLTFANSNMFNHPWAPLVPGLPILLCSLAINYIGDGLRDALDPRSRL